MSGLLDRVLCPRCGGALDVHAPACGACGARFPRVGAIPVLLPEAEAHVALWRRQLAKLLANGASTRTSLEAEARAPGLGALAAARLAALARAVSDQVDDFAAVLGPALGGPLDEPTPGLPRGVVEYITYLYRDWGWTGPDARENEAALAALREVASAPLGRTLVVGAGACRLAYDAHRALGATETAVLDIDPYLLVIAEAVVRGRAVRLTEASLNVAESSRVAIAWTLAAPAPLAPDAFHVFLANGLAPPFAPATFDTIVTPWFIDRVPDDLPAFLETLRGLLVPGGRWLNQGPLLYPAERPLAQRLARDEIAELTAAHGFHLGKSTSESRPYLVSPLSGAGKIERVITFEATLPAARKAHV
ncbi:MAG TPA: hypothetical protein VHJ20_21625 [Polyangia bacterium]|nr:hypothetical protein [Polyangia bacterium]